MERDRLAVNEEIAFLADEVAGHGYVIPLVLRGHLITPIFALVWGPRLPHEFFVRGIYTQHKIVAAGSIAEVKDCCNIGEFPGETNPCFDRSSPSEIDIEG